jgi:hypothetical protein
MQVLVLMENLCRKVLHEQQSQREALLDIAKVVPALQDLKGKHPAAEEHTVTLGILACDKFGGREWSG